MLPWPLMALEFHGVSFHTGSIKTTRKGISILSEETSACRTALSISSGSYFGSAMQNPVHWKRKEFVAAPKVSSSGKAEQYVILSVI